MRKVPHHVLHANVHPNDPIIHETPTLTPTRERSHIRVRKRSRERSPRNTHSQNLSHTHRDRSPWIDSPRNISRVGNPNPNQIQNHNQNHDQNQNYTRQSTPVFSDITPCISHLVTPKGEIKSVLPSASTAFQMNFTNTAQMSPLERANGRSPKYAKSPRANNDALTNRRNDRARSRDGVARDADTGTETGPKYLTKPPGSRNFFDDVDSAVRDALPSRERSANEVGEVIPRPEDSPDSDSPRQLFRRHISNVALTNRAHSDTPRNRDRNDNLDGANRRTSNTTTLGYSIERSVSARKECNRRGDRSYSSRRRGSRGDRSYSSYRRRSRSHRRSRRRSDSRDRSKSRRRRSRSRRSRSRDGSMVRVGLYRRILQDDADRNRSYSSRRSSRSRDRSRGLRRGRSHGRRRDSRDYSSDNSSRGRSYSRSYSRSRRRYSRDCKSDHGSDQDVSPGKIAHDDLYEQIYTPSGEYREDSAIFDDDCHHITDVRFNRNAAKGKGGKGCHANRRVTKEEGDRFPRHMHHLQSASASAATESVRDPPRGSPPIRESVSMSAERVHDSSSESDVSPGTARAIRVKDMQFRQDRRRQLKRLRDGVKHEVTSTPGDKVNVTKVTKGAALRDAILNRGSKGASEVGQARPSISVPPEQLAKKLTFMDEFRAKTGKSLSVEAFYHSAPSSEATEPSALPSAVTTPFKAESVQREPKPRAKAETTSVNREIALTSLGLYATDPQSSAAPTPASRISAESSNFGARINHLLGAYGNTPKREAEAVSAARARDGMIDRWSPSVSEPSSDPRVFLRRTDFAQRIFSNAPHHAYIRTKIPMHHSHVNLAKLIDKNDAVFNNFPF